MYNTFFKDELLIIQPQLLLCLINSRKLKEATSLLGIQKSTKYRKVKQNVFDNINSVLKYFGKSQKQDVSVARRVIQTSIDSSSNIKDCLTQHMEKVMGTSRKTLYKHRKF
jgi:predicted DNA-binding transcriptional regulator AlpA